MYNQTELDQETNEIITNLLEDGSDPNALYIVEHHIAHQNFDKLEKLVIDIFKLGYEIADAEEFEDENGNIIFCCDVVTEIELKPELIAKQQQEILPLIAQAGAEYEGWGTYFEDPNAPDDEYVDDVEFMDDEQ
ncbi:ribonuclease E inhibitor RraB [Phocoenobacter skyensis]|uniref:Regulator of ribonuclease activity B n=1 Tax=Phocoenobacter skyensis TaxID=97481 RepID=A0A1H7VHA8_9PAST|nr:ribonuclease E inhibitor RraB [Pasteurella skyensis]MDP8079338.1 ribonuclease E inhibitor RraB [Pasteurella skyensis]MDP8085210.1 ribonuclease E inhibitor RraB [Pasteurella skyensis]MDP8162665.1 ribonuclease E inhibitor RraB [Pasteurella skyensis]MDP8171401.1 ribonuclease E inhibitor RraB [Pasteurella skyensis]MDP8173433.1 ribonuclease E inhibitor RraB [Pasteurella skyensis]